MSDLSHFTNEPKIIDKVSSLFIMKNALLREPNSGEEVDGAKEEDDQTWEYETKVEVIVAWHLIKFDLKYIIWS